MTDCDDCRSVEHDQVKGLTEEGAPCVLPRLLCTHTRTLVHNEGAPLLASIALDEVCQGRFYARRGAA